MLKASEQEFNRLVKEKSEIKDCITKYIGYIISGFGIGGIVIKFSVEGNPSMTVGMLIVLLIVITFFLEIIWHKIKSHNQIVGYLQLMSQEQNFYKLDNYYDKTDKKKYLIQPGIKYEHEELIKMQNFSTWEFIKSRLSSDDFLDKVKDQHKAIRKATYHFIPPKTLGFQKLPVGQFENWDVEFFETIIAKIYQKIRPSFKKKSTLIHLFHSFKFIYFVNNRSIPVKAILKARDRNIEAQNKIMGTNQPIDLKYFISGWSYPIKILQISFTLFFIILLVAFYQLKQLSPFVLCDESISIFGECILVTLWKSFHLAKFVPTIYFLLLLSLLFLWIWRYVFRLPQIVYGDGSIDYYCWKFLGYRVQVLNHHQIVPEYFSRSYIRFHKSKVLLYQINNNLSVIGVNIRDNFKGCQICKASKVDKNIKRFCEKKGNLNLNRCVNLIDICSKCYAAYEVQLRNYTIFDEVGCKVHDLMYPKLKKYISSTPNNR